MNLNRESQRSSVQQGQELGQYLTIWTTPHHLLGGRREARII
jgi:hypothetical protein